MSARIPTQYDKYCQDVLDKMKEEAKAEDDTLVWYGSLTNLVRQVTLNKGHYGKISDMLRDTGAIRNIRRGGGGAPSAYEVCRTNFLYDDDGQPITYDAPDWFGQSPTRRNETQLIQLGQRVNNLERRVDQLLEAVIALARGETIDAGQEVPTTEGQEAEGGTTAGGKSADELRADLLGLVATGEADSR